MLAWLRGLGSVARCGVVGRSPRVGKPVALIMLDAVVTTQVTMRPISEGEVEAYIASGEPRGKAGAYAVQETGDRFVEQMVGPFDNVVGMPMERVRSLLGELADAVFPG